MKISDALLSLFVDRPRRTPEIPVRLSYSEVIAAGEADATDEVDWADVDFDDEPAQKSEPDDVEIIFAGNLFFEHWAGALPRFYLESAGAAASGNADDPRLRTLVTVLSTVEAVRL